MYNRLQIRVADENLKIITQFKYEIPFKNGRVASPVEDVNCIQGRYTCRFSNVNSRSQLILRIGNFIGPPSHSYWIDDILTQQLAFLINQKTIQIQFCGLTLNHIYENIYDEWDEIVEKITP